MFGLAFPVPGTNQENTKHLNEQKLAGKLVTTERPWSNRRAEEDGYWQKSFLNALSKERSQQERIAKYNTEPTRKNTTQKFCHRRTRHAVVLPRTTVFNLLSILALLSSKDIKK